MEIAAATLAVQEIKFDFVERRGSAPAAAAVAAAVSVMAKKVGGSVDEVA